MYIFYNVHPASYFRPLVLNWGRFCSQETPAIVWTRSGGRDWSRRRDALAAGGWRPGVLPGSLQRTGWPPAETELPQVHSAEADTVV